MDTVLRWISHRAAWAVVASFAAACASSSSATDLHPEGPPMVEQVRMEETYSAGASTGLTRVVFGFGTHPDATADDEHPVTTATAAGNKFRIIMDELLRGNNLEEIKCRFPIDADAFGRVPVGATPDDIARCSVAQDVLPARCPGSNPRSVCICDIDAGCCNSNNTDPSGTPVTPCPSGTPVTPKGDSVGVLDADQDGAADAFRFIRGAVGIRCGAIDVPIDVDNSYWTPSGDQQTPAQGGFDALGPAVVLVPAALPTNLDCSIAFSPDVVDKDGNQVCAPADGDLAAGCMPGDTSAVHFHVEPMTLTVASPITPQGQKRTDDIVVQSNVPVLADLQGNVANIMVTEDPATNYTQFTAKISPGSPKQVTIHWTAVGGLAASTHYTITVPTTVTDQYQQGPLQPLQIAFTTAAM